MVTAINPGGIPEVAVRRDCELSLDVWVMGVINMYKKPLIVCDGTRVRTEWVQAAKQRPGLSPSHDFFLA